MKRFLQSILAISLLFTGVANATNLTLDKKPKRSEKTAVIVVWDIISLNHPEQSGLFDKNFSQYKKDFTEKAFRKLKVKQVEYLVMGQTTNSVATVKNRKPKRTYRDSLKAIEEVKSEIKFIDTTKVGKDVVSTIEQVNSIVDEQYQEFNHIITVYYSNFRQTINRSKLKQMKSINLHPKITKMLVFGNSGLQFTKGISSSQVLNASSNVKNFFINKLPKEKVSWYTNY